MGIYLETYEPTYGPLLVAPFTASLIATSGQATLSRRDADGQVDGLHTDAVLTATTAVAHLDVAGADGHIGG